MSAGIKKVAGVTLPEKMKFFWEYIKSFAGKIQGFLEKMSSSFKGKLKSFFLSG